VVSAVAVFLLVFPVIQGEEVAERGRRQIRHVAGEPGHGAAAGPARHRTRARSWLRCQTSFWPASRHRTPARRPGSSRR
jgi:hypothetical protein